MSRACTSLFLAALVAMAACKKKPEVGGDPMLPFKRLDELPTFAIELSPAARASLSESPRTWVKATFRHGGQTLEEVGVRLKGHRSMRKLEDKPALKVRFDKYRKGQMFKGVKRLTLNNMVEDPTMLREVLGYRLYRELGVPAPAAFYAQLTLDGEPYGLYAVIETIDKDFLESHFADASGGLYEGEYGCDLYEGDIDGFDRDSGKKGNRDDLRAFAAAAKSDADMLFADDGPIDMKAFLAYLAVSAFIGDFDGYRHAHNYRIYHEPTLGKWTFIPWGIDRSFKQQLSIFESYGLLARKCFASATCRARYVRVQREVVTAFDKLALDEGALALAAFIEPALREGNKRTPKAKRINQAREKLVTFLRERPASIGRETQCIGADGSEVDGDGDGYGCLDCDDASAAIHPGAKEACDGIDNDCSGAVDDNPECPTCEILESGGRRFALCDLPRPWTEAASYCRGMNGALASIRSPAEDKALAAAATRKSKGRWWLGLNDRETEGVFVDGSTTAASGPASYANWAPGEPDNHTCNQDCAVLDAARKGRWHDTHCGQMLPFICQLPGDAPTPKPPALDKTESSK